MELKKLFFMIICTCFALLLLQTKSNAAEEISTSIKLNEVDVPFVYNLNSSNEIENLKCTNKSLIEGDIVLPSTIDGHKVVSIGGYTSGGYAFEGATNMTSVTIPDTVTEIGGFSFQKCTSLTKIDLKNVEKIGQGIIKDCNNLTTITIPKTLKNDGGWSSGKLQSKYLKEVIFEEGITSIPSDILDGCTEIKNVIIPSSATVIGEKAFEETQIEEIEIPENVIEIDSFAFKNCANLKKITILNENAELAGINYQDLIFENHNEDLTIYCYEGSTAAEYAIKYNIKYVYLTRESSTQNSEIDSSIEGDEENKNNDTKIKEDNTTVPSKTLPNTGSSIAILLIIVVIFTIGLIYYKKYRQIKKTIK